MAKKNLTYKPPLEVSQEAAKGLLLRRKFRRGGTMVGVARARDLKNRRHVSGKTIFRMVSYFRRHAVDRQAPGFGNDDNLSPGYVAWLLWGGDAGAYWAERKKQKIKKSNQRKTR